MPSRRIRRAWLAAAAAATLAFTGLAGPATAKDLPPDVPGSWIQEPRASEGAASAFSSRAAAAPGGDASPGGFTLSPGESTGTSCWAGPM
ncbi:hypothetical protein ACIQZO_09740 [Streptomyces sp. NPDC097617]|uniref:hypothetical protein n=1 Tax=Streptomyces sp. NPDC097617 TaxID=3366091 RepID=UPI003823119F